MDLIKDIDIISVEEAQACDFKTTADENTGKTKKNSTLRATAVR